MRSMVEREYPQANRPEGDDRTRQETQTSAELAGGAALARIA